MNSLPLLPGCAGCRLNRRRFLGAGATLCAAGWLAAPKLIGAETAGKPRLRIVYALHAPKQPRPDWPNQGFDFEPVMRKMNTDLARRCPGFEFVPTMAKGPEEAQKILAEDQSKPVDGYVVVQMNCWNRVVQTLAASGKPVLYADFQYGGSGGFLVYTAAFLRANAPNVGFVASSNPEDLAAAVRCFDLLKQGGTVAEFVAATKAVRLKATAKPGSRECLPDPLKTIAPEECHRRMKESKILSVRNQEEGPAAPMMDIPVQKVSFAEVNEAWKTADKEASQAVAARWRKNAALVEGVSPETLETSAAMYLAQKAVLQKYGANAITINCLGGFYGGHIHAYPCLGFHELLNEGLVGACECDVRSTATMVAMSLLTQGRPGYISDPVMDSAKRQIIYAHCVASNRAFGPAGRTNPYQILTHSEDRQGASVRSLLPTGYLTTTLEIARDKKEILMHQAKAVDNDLDDRACRTKLAAEPLGDFEKLFTHWDQYGWHRVTFYGDLKEPVLALASVMGWQVVEEA